MSCSAAGGLDEPRSVEPPDRAGAESGDGLGPELVAVARERVEVDRAAADRPEAAVAGLVAQVGLGVDGAGEHTLARHLDGVAAIGRPEAVGGAGQERLDPRDLGPADGVELGDLDDPDALHVHGGVLGAEVRQLVGEPVFAGEDLQRGRLPRALRAFEDQHVVGLDAGRKMRATAEISQSAPNARLKAVSSAPR